MANTHDPNLNVGLPVFTIHGNHDDPSGPENLSAVDLLSAVHYVNYFGKHTMTREGTDDVGKIVLSPVLLMKVRHALGSCRPSTCRSHRSLTQWPAQSPTLAATRATRLAPTLESVMSRLHVLWSTAPSSARVFLPFVEPKPRLYPG